MSKFTTGEVAKLCNVSVRTVQYYDTRGILCPSELTEGGRRLYSEDDLDRLRVICFLREIGMPLKSISELLREDNSENIIDILLQQQETELKRELDDASDKLKKISMLRSKLGNTKDFSIKSIGDIAYQMKSKSKLRKIRATMLTTGIAVEALEIASILLWIKQGIWWPFAIVFAIVIVYSIWISKYYFSKVSYICPQCHTVFKPKFKEAFWANHTPNTRKLRCPQCSHKGFCVEIATEDEKA